MARSTETSEGFIVQHDIFNGLSLDVSKQKFSTDEEFYQMLSDALPKWKASGICGLWAKIPLKYSSLITVFAKCGFDFHHANPGYVQMNQWLPETETNNLPEYANQYLGVAGLVINNDGKILAIKERYSYSRTHSGQWKLPGGHANKGENLAETAIREVHEETGIECKFVSIGCFRHQHNYRYGCSDFYFVCHMRPCGGEMKPCPQEISECCWMDVEEFLSDPDITENNRYFVKCYKEGFSNHPAMAIIPESVISYNRKSSHEIYSIHNS